MSTTSSAADRSALFAAACAVALATAVGTPGIAAAAKAADDVAIGNLERYCASSWRNAGIRRDEWDDCTQQALLELLEEVSPGGLSVALDDSESPERRELNRAVWRQTQRCRRAARLERFDERFVLADRARGNPETAKYQWGDVRQVAGELLTERQWIILERTRDGWRTAEIAADLGIAAARVSDEKYKALAKLRRVVPSEHG